MIKSFILFLLATVFMYCAFFSWYIITDHYWSWARIPTVILFCLLSIAHVWLLVVNLFGVDNAKG